MLLQNCQQQFCYRSIEEKYSLRKELILSVYPSRDSPFVWTEDTCVYMEVSFFLTNSPYDKLIQVLWNIYISLASLTRDIINKSIKADIFLASIFHFHSILPKPSILKTKLKNPTHKDEAKRDIQFVHTDICHFRWWQVSTSLNEQVCFHWRTNEVLPSINYKKSLSLVCFFNHVNAIYLLHRETNLHISIH